MSPFINVLDDIYYNEYDPYAAQWLRNLMALGVIAPGVVDERSIEDVTPDDLRGFTQCHFFAGIGVWSFALRSAGWADDREIWTGSCPCQPFSAAGAGAGFADERHLWPAFHHLIAERRPAIVLGEQVASSHVDPWIDLVHADMEALGYAFGGIPFPSAGVGAPHIRDRLYWGAHADDSRRIGRWAGQASDGRDAARIEPERFRHVNGLADSAGGRRREECADSRGLDIGDRAQGVAAGLEHGGSDSGLAHPDGAGQGTSGRPGLHSQGQARPLAALGHEPGGLGDADSEPAGRHAGAAHAAQARHGAQDDDHGPGHAGGSLAAEQPGPTNGYWRAADWLGCRDGKWRPVEPGTFPLAHGAAGRVGRGGTDWRTAAGEEGKGHRAGRLKGYGNAINAEAARIFVKCVMEVM